MKAEKETLGLYLSGHPIDEYLGELSHLSRDRLSSLRPERAPQPVAGLLIDVRTMRNKAGDTIAFLTLDDRSARFEIRLFAKEYERFRDILQKDQILIVDCTVSMDDYSGGMQGRGKEVMTLEQARQRRARSITLSLRSDALALGFSERLAEMLESHRLKPSDSMQLSPFGSAAASNHSGREDGSLGCGIAISYQREASKGCIMLSNEWRVAPSNELVQRLRSEYGRRNVVVDY